MVDGYAVPAGRVEPLRPQGFEPATWESGRMEAARVEPSQPASTEEAEAAERTIRIFRDFHYRIDEASGRIVVEIRDGVSGELIRQVPPEEMLRVARSIQAFLGLQIDRRV